MTTLQVLNYERLDRGLSTSPTGGVNPLKLFDTPTLSATGDVEFLHVRW